MNYSLNGGEATATRAARGSASLLVRVPFRRDAVTPTKIALRRNTNETLFPPSFPIQLLVL